MIRQRKHNFTYFPDHTKDLDWCQIGEKEVVGHERLATLLPVIKHMTPIGLTTPSQFSVSCLSACPRTFVSVCLSVCLSV